jgi:hypothetical protein
MVWELQEDRDPPYPVSAIAQYLAWADAQHHLLAEQTNRCRVFGQGDLSPSTHLAPTLQKLLGCSS